MTDGRGGSLVWEIVILVCLKGLRAKRDFGINKYFGIHFCVSLSEGHRKHSDILITEN